jgi:type IV secretion system protein VirB1
MLELLLAQCVVPDVEREIMAAVARVESARNPYAIGVVGGRLARQPQNLAEAVATADALRRDGWNYSIGISQVNQANFYRYGLTHSTGFGACANLRAGSAILAECMKGARARFGADQALPHALSCYYSGDWYRGLRPDANGSIYVARVLSAIATNKGAVAIPVMGGKKKGMAARPAARQRRAAKVGGRYAYLDAEPMMYAGSEAVSKAEDDTEERAGRYAYLDAEPMMYAGSEAVSKAEDTEEK